MRNRNSHTFDFNLPLIPDREPEDVSLIMDGRRLEGVKGLNIKAGTNGFTNVAVQFEARCAVRFVARLIADPEFANNEDADLRLAELYRRAQAEIERDLEQDGEDLSASYIGQAALVRRLLSLLIEEIK